MTKNTRTPSAASAAGMVALTIGKPRVPARCPRMTNAMEMARSPSSDATREFGDCIPTPPPPTATCNLDLQTAAAATLRQWRLQRRYVGY